MHTWLPAAAAVLPHVYLLHLHMGRALKSRPAVNRCT
jgi:hypothetical protein